MLEGGPFEKLLYFQSNWGHQYYFQAQYIKILHKLVIRLVYIDFNIFA